MHYILLRIIKFQLIAIYNMSEVILIDLVLRVWISPSVNEFARVEKFERVEVFPSDLFKAF